MKKILTVLLLLGLVINSCDDKGEGDGTSPHTHDYGTAWKSNATQHWRECTANDGAKTDIAPHTAGDWIIVPATYDTDGSQHKKCTICEYTTDTETIAKFKTEQPFTIGSVNFIFEYRKDDTTSWAKLEPAIQTFITFITENPESQHNANAVDLALRVGAEYRIIVDYSNEGKDAGFTATDGQTLTVGSEYLVTDSLNRNRFRDAFQALLDKPWPIP